MVRQRRLPAYSLLLLTTISQLSTQSSEHALSLLPSSWSTDLAAAQCFVCAFSPGPLASRTESMLTICLCAVIGFSSLAACLLAEAVLQSHYLGTNSTSGLAACLVFIYLYIVCYQFVDAPSFIWCAEIFPTTIRAKGISLAFFAYFVGAITYTTPSALAFKNM